MFKIRDARESDLNDLFDLSQKANLLNLPANKNKLNDLIIKSQKSFKTPSNDLENNYYIFCLEDEKASKVIGVSMIHGKHGTPEKPHYYLKVGKEVKQSNSLKTKIVNQTLKLGIEPNGFTEIGGLVLSPDYRKSKFKLGKILSMSRFLYIVMHRHLFTETIHSELLPPFDKNGKSLLWEGLGRRFLNMDYWEADLLSQQDKTFIHDLFPSSTIYQNLLPQSALDVIGEVGESTKPVKNMLEKIGFNYMSEVDPFDGGPHYRAKITDLTPFKNFTHLEGKTILENINNDQIFLALNHFGPEEKFCVKGLGLMNKAEITEKETYTGFYI